MDMAHERDASSEEEVMAGELRRGPWTVEEDLLLVNYVASHGEGRWNSLARSAGEIHTPCMSDPITDQLLVKTCISNSWAPSHHPPSTTRCSPIASSSPRCRTKPEA